MRFVEKRSDALKSECDAVGQSKQLQCYDRLGKEIGLHAPHRAQSSQHQGEDGDARHRVWVVANQFGGETLNEERSDACAAYDEQQVNAHFAGVDGELITAQRSGESRHVERRGRGRRNGREEG